MRWRTQIGPRSAFSSSLQQPSIHLRWLASSRSHCHARAVHPNRGQRLQPRAVLPQRRHQDHPGPAEQLPYVHSTNCDGNSAELLDVLPIDRRRRRQHVRFAHTFMTTDASPYYDAFIRWQVNKLYKLGKIKFGKRPTACIPNCKDGLPCVDPDCQDGEGLRPRGNACENGGPRVESGCQGCGCGQGRRQDGLHGSCCFAPGGYVRSNKHLRWHWHPVRNPVRNLRC